MLVKLVKHSFRSPLCLVAVLTLSGCTLFFDKVVEYEIIEPESYPTLHAVGYAPISTQPGKSDDEKSIMAMRASKLDAYRELAELVYGQQLEGQQSLGNLVMQNSTLRASVQGVIRGAQIVKAYPVGTDTYATEMSLDMKKVRDIYMATAKPQRVKNVTYY